MPKTIIGRWDRRYRRHWRISEWKWQGQRYEWTSLNPGGSSVTQWWTCPPHTSILFQPKWHHKSIHVFSDITNTTTTTITYHHQHTHRINHQKQTNTESSDAHHRNHHKAEDDMILAGKNRCFFAGLMFQLSKWLFWHKERDLKLHIAPSKETNRERERERERGRIRFDMYKFHHTTHTHTHYTILGILYWKIYRNYTQIEITKMIMMIAEKCVKKIVLN